MSNPSLQYQGWIMYSEFSRRTMFSSQLPMTWTLRYSTLLDVIVKIKLDIISFSNKEFSFYIYNTLLCIKNVENLHMARILVKFTWTVSLTAWLFHLTQISNSEIETFFLQYINEKTQLCLPPNFYLEVLNLAENGLKP